MMKQSNLEAIFAQQIRAMKLPAPENEYRFHSKRQFRFDFAWPELKIAVEVEGGVFSGGRHTRGVGFTKDCEKYNIAVFDGWDVYRFTGDQVNSGYAIDFVIKVMEK